MSPQKVKPHGTRACYARGCRRSECVAANAEYAKLAHRRKVQRGTANQTFVDAGPACQRLRDLVAAGVSLHEVHRQTGIGRERLGRLKAGEYNGGRGIYRTTHDRIMAVRVPRGATQDGQLVDACETRAMLDEMIAAGVPKVRIARALGAGPRTVWLQVARSDRVLKRTADRVEALYWRAWLASPALRLLCDREPPRWAIERAREMAGV